MIDKYILMHKDVAVGELTYNTKDKKFHFQRYDNITERKYLPLGMYSFENWNIDYKPTSDDIEFWIKERVVPEERQNIDEILNAIGLMDYDFWEICRRTRGMCMEDYFWLSKGEKYEEVNMRYLSEQDRIRETPIPFYAEPYEAEYKVVGNKIVKN